MTTILSLNFFVPVSKYIHKYVTSGLTQILWRNSKRNTILLILSTNAAKQPELTNYMKVGILGLDLKDVKNFNVPIFDNVVIYRRSNFDNTVYTSRVTVVEFHSEAGEIWCIFAPQWAPSKDFLISYKKTWGRAIKNWAQFYKISLPEYEQNWKWF